MMARSEKEERHEEDKGSDGVVQATSPRGSGRQPTRLRFIFIVGQKKEDGRRQKGGRRKDCLSDSRSAFQHCSLGASRAG